MDSRLRRLRKKMVEDGVPALIVSGLENLRYLSGFTGSAGLGLVTPVDAFFFADPRYHLQAGNECGEFTVVPCQMKLWQDLSERVKGLGLPALGVEKNHLTLGQ